MCFTYLRAHADLSLPFLASALLCAAWTGNLARADLLLHMNAAAILQKEYLSGHDQKIKMCLQWKSRNSQPHDAFLQGGVLTLYGTVFETLFQHVSYQIHQESGVQVLKVYGRGVFLAVEVSHLLRHCWSCIPETAEGTFCGQKIIQVIFPIVILRCLPFREQATPESFLDFSEDLSAHGVAEMVDNVVPR